MRRKICLLCKLNESVRHKVLILTAKVKVDSLYQEICGQQITRQLINFWNIFSDHIGEGHKIGSFEGDRKEGLQSLPFIIIHNVNACCLQWH